MKFFKKNTPQFGGYAVLKQILEEEKALGLYRATQEVITKHEKYIEEDLDLDTEDEDNVLFN